MNKRFYCLVFALLSLVFIFSCSKSYLDRPIMGVQDEEDFFNSPGAAYQSVINAYLGLNSNFWGSMASMAELGDIATDDAEKGGSDAGDRPFVADLGYGRALSSNETLSGYWAARYRAIGNCNVTIDNLAKATNLLDANGDPLSSDMKNRYVAEVKFLRAKFYFDLVRIFGGVPLITTNPDIDQRDKVTRASSEDVFTFIEKELLDAIPNLPKKANLPGSELGRVTQEAGWALLSRGYLFFARSHNDFYAKARDAAKTVIDSHSFSLVPNYQSLWLPDGYQTNEPVFMVMLRYMPASQIFGSALNVYLSPRSTGAWGFDSPTESLVNEFEKGDPRLLFTVIDNGDIFPLRNGGNEVLDFSTNPNTGHYGKKVFLIDSRRDNGWGSNTWNYYLIRYSDVLLMYAEALLNSGGDKQTVADYINMVRNRASNSSKIDVEAVQRMRTIENVSLPEVKASDDLDLAIKHERRVEFGCEFLRLFDLIRWGNYVETMHDFSNQPYSGGRGSGFKKPSGDRFVFPIPQVEIDRSNGSITQNEGY